MRQTKIVATIGPASEGVRMLPRLLDAGVDVVRYNWSHGNDAEFKMVVRRVRDYSKRTGKHVAVLQDLQGPKVRVGEMAPGVVLKTGSTVEITAKPVLGTAERFTSQYKLLPKDVKPKDTILLDDGLIELQVISTSATALKAKVVTGGPLISHKGINVPSASLSIPAITAKDKRDLLFGLSVGVDFVALSFVKSATDVVDLRRRIKRAGSTAKIIAKIEKHEAITNFDAILEATDGVMVARGDLGVELPPQEVPLLQKKIIHAANRAGKPVITATQMLESMITHPRATRAEVSDVANAILDGTDAVMLSAESATGAYPVQAVRTLVQTATDVEQFFNRSPLRGTLPAGDLTVHAVSMGASELAKDINANLIVVPTASGASARAVARHRVRMPVVALTTDLQVARELALVWGIQADVVPKYRGYEQMTELAKQFVRERKLAKRGDTMVILSGLPLHEPGATNNIQVQEL